MNETALAPVNNNVEVTATRPLEMHQAQSALVVWCAGKIGQLRAEQRDVRDALEQAKKNKWAHGALDRQVRLYERRIVFYGKMKRALEAGYYIVPNFPVTMFAVRTEQNKPGSGFVTDQWHPGDAHFEQHAQQLEEGEGEYRNPFPLVRSYAHKDDKGKDVHDYWADAWRDLEFPVTMMKAKCIEATNKAMGLMVFDEFGICPPRQLRRGDPIIVGRLIDPRSTKYDRKTVSFLIAWHLDTATL